MKKKVLIITPYFAPQSHAAVFRAYKLAKHLPSYGWKPYVITTDINYLYNEDPTLLEQLPAEVEIFRTRYIEPTLRGVRMALGGKDRTFKKIKRSLSESRSQSAISTKKGLPERIYKYLIDRYFQNPDAHWTWVNSAVKKAAELMKQEEINIVFTTSPPFSNYTIGQELKKKGAKWVADFRDPGSYNVRTFSKIDSTYLKQRSLERAAVHSADALTIASSAFRYIFTDMYGTLKNRVEFIPTGLDSKLILSTQRPTIPNPYLVFSGEFMAEYDSVFFNAMGAALKNPRIKSGNWKVLFIGREEINRPLVEPHLKKNGLMDLGVFIDHVPQQELYSYLLYSRGALLIPGRDAYWWNLFAKLVDYAALGIPVVAVLPEISEARRVLQQLGTGVFLDGDAANTERVLTDFLITDRHSLNANPQGQSLFMVETMVKKMIEVFESI